jgi:hypothetical protein
MSKPRTSSKATKTTRKAPAAAAKRRAEAPHTQQECTVTVTSSQPVDMQEFLARTEKRLATARKAAGKRARRAARACRRKLGIKPGKGWRGFSYHWRRKLARGLRRLGRTIAPPPQTRLAKS